MGSVIKTKRMTIEVDPKMFHRISNYISIEKCADY